jgi:hypothetical protein
MQLLLLLRVPPILVGVLAATCISRTFPCGAGVALLLYHEYDLMESINILCL